MSIVLTLYEILVPEKYITHLSVLWTRSPIPQNKQGQVKYTLCLSRLYTIQCSTDLRVFYTWYLILKFLLLCLFCFYWSFPYAKAFKCCLFIRKDNPRCELWNCQNKTKQKFNYLKTATTDNGKCDIEVWKHIGIRKNAFQKLS